MTRRDEVVIVDYEAGNLRSVELAVAHLGAAAVTSADPERVRTAERVIFPGVGGADAAMAVLRNRGLDAALREVHRAGRPMLGICVGCQVIFDSSEEGPTDCLGLVPGRVVRIQAAAGRKVPHMGWNVVRRRRRHPLVEGIADEETLRGGSAQQAGCVKERLGMRLRMGDPVAAHHAGRTVGDSEGVEQAAGQMVGLVGHDAPRESARLDGAEQGLHAGKKAGVHRDAGRVEIEEAAADSFRQLRLGRPAEGRAHHRPAAAGDGAAVAFGREWVERVHRDRRVHGRGKVREGVGQSPVEIEEHRFDGAPSRGSGRAG